MVILDRLLSRKIIIGVHGLDNKPPPELLDQWWRKAIAEGLSQIGAPGMPFAFEQVYWADVLHERLLDPKIGDPEDSLYLNDPYVPGHPGVYVAEKNLDKRKRLLKALEEKLFDPAYDGQGLGIANNIANALIHKKFEDLEAYMRGTPPVRSPGNQSASQLIRERLAKTLYRHRGKKILLIGHSMGSIVVYDTLTRDVPNINVHTLITIGSPLGLPPVMRQICRRAGLEFRKDVRVPSPGNVTRRWFNFADLEDPVATNFDLADDYEPNKQGIGPVDVQIRNNYEYQGRHDAHSLYGYLRAPEVAGVVREFLGK